MSTLLVTDGAYCTLHVKVRDTMLAHSISRSADCALALVTLLSSEAALSNASH
jgi:hypothetical protein